MTIPKVYRIKVLAGYNGKAPQGVTDMDAYRQAEFWRAEAATVNVAIYSDATTVADTTGLTEVEMLISSTPNHASPLVTKTATVGSGLDLTVTDADFLAGTAQHATFALAAGDLDPDMAGEASRTMYLRLAATVSGATVVLANGEITVHEAGAM